MDPRNYTFHHNNHFAKIKYSLEDIRFTTKGNYLYTTCLGRPDGDLKIAALKSSFKVRKGDILSITHLGTGKKIEFDHNDEALILRTEGVEMNGMANSFKIELNFLINEG